MEVTSLASKAVHLITTMLDLVLRTLSIPIVKWSLICLFVSWITAEIIFYFYLRYIVLPLLNRLTAPPPESIHTCWEQFHRIIDTVAQIKGNYDFERFFSGWFRKAAIKDIRRGNIRQMLSWCLYSKSVGDLTMRERACIEDVMIWLKMRLQINAPEGYNPEIKPMLLTLENIQYVHRPLVFYAMLTVVQVIGHTVLMFLGFKRHEINGMAYWYRSCSQTVAPKEQNVPLIFFHGISPGLNLYLLVVHILSQKRKAVLVEVPHIAMCLNFKAKRLGDMVKTVEIISKRHRMPHFAVAGHSFGSLPAAWVSKHLKHAVKQLILLDPVSLLLGLPDVCYNFLSKRPQSLMEYIIHFGGSTEITIHHTLRRQFWWYEGQLLLDEIKCPVYIGLSGNDEIVPSDVLRTYIEDYYTRHHLEEHQRYRQKMAHHNHHHHHNHNHSQGCSTNGNGQKVGERGDAADAEAERDKEGQSCCPRKCELGTAGKGCIYNRIQYVFWEGWSHGFILFAHKQLKELDQALREQEVFFRAPEVTAAIDASVRKFNVRPDSIDITKSGYNFDVDGSQDDANGYGVVPPRFICGKNQDVPHDVSGSKAKQPPLLDISKTLYAMASSSSTTNGHDGALSPTQLTKREISTIPEGKKQT